MRDLIGVMVIATMLAVTGAASAACYPKTTGDAPKGSAKAALNILKNRITSLSGLEQVSVGDILAYSDQEDTALEAKAVMLTGILLDAHHEGPESPNCKSKTRRDYHIWIGAHEPNGSESLDSLRDKSVVVELTPNIQDKHKKWTAKLSSLKGKMICISGWLMFDPEHPPQLGKTRGTLWEVHPIMGIGEISASGDCVGWN